MKQYILDELSYILEGDEFSNTKDVDSELSDTICKLERLGVLKKDRYKYSVNDLKKLSKVIELKSISKFIEYEAKYSDTVNNITNNISNSNINQIDQSSLKRDLSKPKTQIKVQTIDKEPNKKSWIEILSWIIGIAIGVIGIYKFIISVY